VLCLINLLFASQHNKKTEIDLSTRINDFRFKKLKTDELKERL